MDLKEALKILNLSGREEWTEVKKQYRRLMHMVHPDSLGNSAADYYYSAHEINGAYEYLCGYYKKAGTIGNADYTVFASGSRRDGGNKRPGWNAPVNDAAFAPREIYQYIDGIDGVHRGTFVVGTGKYMMSGDEDFRLFLLSIYNLSLRLLGDMGEVKLSRLQPELAYLLSQQFVDCENIISGYEIEAEGSAKTYYIPAMLETEGRRCLAAEGTVLVPKGVRNHRLYLSNEAGRELGYISFADDKLYYALVPLFEQRSVQVKIRVSGSILGNNNVRQIKVKSLDLWLRMEERDIRQVTISLSERIRKLLEEAESC